MPTWLLFAIPAIVWSTTFYAIKLQLPHAHPAISLTYRFAIACACMFVVAKALRQPLRIPYRIHLQIIGLGILQYSCSYSLTYNAERFAPSGLASLAFTLLVFLNPIGGYLFFHKQLTRRVAVGAGLGFVGIVTAFASPLGPDPMIKLGLLLLVGATLCSFAGNMLSLRLSALGLPIASFTAWGLLYGTLGFVAYALLSDARWVMPSAPSYWASLVYLGVFGTAVAFGFYTTLLHRIGPIAGYMAVVTPIGAMTLSVLKEDMHVGPRMLVGAALAGVGAVLALYVPSQTVTPPPTSK
jgi:drug/metabolite transporter (DMT)-like permease